MNGRTRRKQNRCLNCEKGIACLLVIVLHCEFPTFIGSIINIVARIGVPLFFIISGFFLYSGDYDKVARRLPLKIKRTINIVIVYYVLNICYEVIVNCMLLKEQTIKEVFSVMSDRKSLYESIFWNRTIIGVGGWFLPALLFCYIIMWFINKYVLYKYAYVMIIPLFTCYFLISRFSFLPVWYSRNYLFMGLPFVVAGHYLACKVDEINKIENWKLFLLFSFGGILGCVERFTGGYDLYLGVIIMVFVAFIFAVNNEDYTMNKHLEYIGENLYLYCYLLHPFAIHMFTLIGDRGNLDDSGWFMWIRPLGVIFVTLAIAMICYKIIKAIKVISIEK